MGKKHKNKHRSDKDFLEAFDMPLEKTSLKLVLKVGGAPSTPEVMIDSLTDDNYSDTDRKQRHKKKKRHHDKHSTTSSSSSHRHHDRKDFRKLEADTEDGEDSEEEMEPVPKRLHLDDDEDDDHLHVRNLREKKSTEDGKTPLQLCLSYLHKILQRKDSNGFFAFPVTDNIAPGYSSIISQPMDFSSMKAKVDDALYSSVAEFRSDYELMMKNCMMYNHPDTVYHKEAKRLLSVGLRHMNREKLIHMKRGLPFMAGVTDQELGLDDDSMVANAADDPTGAGLDGSRVLKAIKTVKVKKSSLGRYEAIADDLTPEEILEQAQSAAQDAAHRVMLQSADSKIGFLRRKEDGTTTLNILNPDDSGFISEKERVVNLGSLTGKLSTGTGMLVSSKEDKRNKVSPVIYLNYGAFSSYAPIYDSSSANISKDDSDLLLSTYADETGLQYAKSLSHFVTDAGDYTISMVDDLLNVLTSGEHAKVMAMLEQEEKEKQEQEVEITEPETDNAAAEAEEPIASNSSLVKNNANDIGIEMSFLNNFDNGGGPLENGNPETQKKLESAAELIMDLQRTQYERLSEKLPEHLAYVRDPSKEEIELANKVTKRLTELVKQVTPGDIVKAESVRAAMGIALLPSNTDADDIARPVSSSASSSSSSSWPVKTGDDAGTTARQPEEMSEELDDDLLDLFQQGTSAEENDLAGNQPDTLAEDQMDVAS